MKTILVLFVILIQFPAFSQSNSNNSIVNPIIRFIEGSTVLNKEVIFIVSLVIISLL